MPRTYVAPLLAVLLSALFVLAPVVPTVKNDVRFPLATVSAQLTDGAPTNATGAEATPTTKTGQTSCSGYLNFFLSPGICIGRLIGALFGSLIVGMAAWLLTIVGVLFNWIMEHTIVLFASSIFNTVKSGVEGAWTAFRDIGNIVIIGMFTFIAISIILGNQTFGAKRMVAKVLIIAVLINFSLLFTTQIINISNFVATQFYNAMGAPGSTANNLPSAAAVATTSRTPPGVSGLFMSYMGMSGFADGFNTTWENAENTNNGLLAFINALFGSMVLIGAAVVLMYGAFLMISRAVLLIFLMLTSALAFASYLIPQLADSGYGWRTWWLSLIKAAVFGPMVMIFLWATLFIAQSVSAASGGGSLGKLISDPTGGWNIGALFNYLLILGLLFASFKVAHVFSNQIAGFNWAQIATATPFFLGARAGGFWARSRYGVSGFATWQEGRLKKRLESAKAVRDNLANSQEQRDAARANAERLTLQIEKYNKLSKQTFNAAGTKLGKDAAKALGMPSIIAGGGKAVSYRDHAETVGKEAAKKTEGLALSKNEQDTVRASAMAIETKQHKEQLEAMKRLEEAAQANAEAARQAAEAHPEQARKGAYQEEVRRAEQEKRDIETQYKKMIENAGSNDDARRSAAQKRDEKLDEQENRIQKAQEEITKLQKEIYAPYEDARTAFEEKAKERTTFEDRMGASIEEATKKTVALESKKSLEHAQDAAAREVGPGTITMKGHMGDTFTANQARAAVKGSLENKLLKKQLGILKELEKESGE